MATMLKLEKITTKGYAVRSITLSQILNRETVLHASGVAFENWCLSGREVIINDAINLHYGKCSIQALGAYFLFPLLL